jgi:hypothetical protein
VGVITELTVCVEITHLSKPLLQSEGSLNWSKHVTPATLSIFQDEKSWSGFSNVDIKRKSNIKEFKDMNGLSWNNMKDAMHLESEGTPCKKGWICFKKLNNKGCWQMTVILKVDHLSRQNWMLNTWIYLVLCQWRKI